MGKKTERTSPLFLGWTDQKLLERQKLEVKYGGFGRGKRQVLVEEMRSQQDEQVLAIQTNIAVPDIQVS